MKYPRQIRHTLFIYCEGKTDHLFIKYLKKLYSVRGSKHITLKKGVGGDASTFILETVKHTQQHEYDEIYIVSDTDQRTTNELQTIEKNYKQKNIQFIWQKPCVEGMFLKILKEKSYTHETSKVCKNLFYKEYSPNNPSLTKSLLNKLFSKKTLDSKRQKISELDQLIKLMEPASDKVSVALLKSEK